MSMTSSDKRAGSFSAAAVSFELSKWLFLEELESQLKTIEQDQQKAIARFEDDGGAVRAVLVCYGCGATEDNPYCYCSC